MKIAEAILEKSCTCWDGYKRVAGTKPCEPNSCIKETNESDDLKTLIQYYKDWFEADSDSDFKDWDIDFGAKTAYLYMPKKTVLKGVLDTVEDFDLNVKVDKSTLDKVVKALEGLSLKHKVRVKGEYYYFDIQDIEIKPNEYIAQADWRRA